MHGRDAADRAAETARATFEEGDDRREPADLRGAARRAGEGLGRAQRQRACRASCTSTGEARRQIKGGGLKVNDEAVTDEKRLLTLADLTPGGRDQALARQEAARADPARVEPLAAIAAGGEACRRPHER